MRHARLALLTLPLLVPVACFQSSDDSMGAPDSSAPLADSGQDTSIPDARAPFGDGGIADTSIADVVVDAAPLPVTVKVTTLSGPEAGILVVFDTAAGVVSGMATTDSTGTVTQVVAAGSQATVVLGTALSSNLVTIVGIEPGDVLSVVDSQGVSIYAAINDVTNAASAPTGAASYAVSAGGCSTGNFTAVPLGVPALLYLYPGCYGATEIPLFLTAYDSNDNPLAYAWQTDTFAGLDAGMLGLTAGGTWSTTTTMQAVTATNVPTDAFGGQVIFSELASGVALSQYGDLPEATDGGVSISPFVVHTGYPSAIQTELDVSTDSFQGSLILAKRESAPTADGATAVDLSQLLPEFTGAGVDTTNPVQPTVTWTSTAAFTAAAGVIAQTAWSTQIDGGYSDGTWTIIAPSTATSAPTPALPSSVAAYAPTASSTFNSGVSVVIIGGTAVPSYAVLRSLQGSFSVPQMLSGGPYVPPLPADGTVVISLTAPFGE
jgi:hypothetical protein